jgi:hypothetical protein
MPTHLEEVSSVFKILRAIADSLQSSLISYPMEILKCGSLVGLLPVHQLKTDPGHSCRKPRPILSLPTHNLQNEPAPANKRSETFSTRLQSQSLQWPLPKRQLRILQQIAKDALTILINLSTDREILENLASDKDFVRTILGRITVCQPLSGSHLLSLTPTNRTPPSPTRISYPCSSRTWPNLTN